MKVDFFMRVRLEEYKDVVNLIYHPRHKPKVGDTVRGNREGKEESIVGTLAHIYEDSEFPGIAWGEFTPYYTTKVLRKYRKYFWEFWMPKSPVTLHKMTKKDLREMLP